MYSVRRSSAKMSSLVAFGRPLEGARRVLSLFACIGGLLASSATASLGQDDPNFIPRDTFHERLERDGNSLNICYNPDGMMAGFEVDLIGALGQALLIDTRAIPLPGTQITTPPLDFRLPVLPEQLYIILAERCSAVIGFLLSSSTPDWLSVTRPYMQTRTVLIAGDPAINSLDDVQFDRPIGSRAMSMADNRLISFLQARPEGRKWRRFPFFSNEVVLEQIRDGKVGAGLIWEPALYFATDGDPAGAGFHVLPEVPFQVPPIEIGIVTRSNETYLNNLLSEGIASLLGDNAVDRLLQKHNLRAPSTPGSGG